LTAQIIIDPGTESVERTVSYAVQALKSAFRNFRDGSVLVLIYNDNERLIGVDLSGLPSEGLQEMVDDFVDKLEANVAQAS